jgi:ketosteroid isomerase-like protein
MGDEQQIRDLINRWVSAVQNKDIDGILTDHAADIVMYDVPQPYRGNHGIDEYRDSWPQFLDWLRPGSVFEIDTLSVVAGSDVAFAYALLRCGRAEDFEREPDNRLRLTVGLRKDGERWAVTHEHHSYPA